MLRIILYFSLCSVLLADAFCFADEAQRRIIERYQEILAKSPKKGATFDRVYDYYVDTGQSTVFYQNCQSAAQNNPADAKTQLLFALVAERRNKTAEAADAFQITAKLEPDNFLPMLYLGELLLNERKVHEAITALEQAQTRLQNGSGSKNDLRTVLQTLASAYTRFGESQKSLDTWNQLADLFPNDPDILVHVAESMEFEGKLDEALKQYRRIIPQTDEPAEKVRLSLAIIDIMLRQGDDKTALNELNALLGLLDSESYLADAVRDRVDRIFERTNDVNRQIEFYQQRIKQAPNDTASLLRLVKTFQRADKNTEAETLLFDTLKVSPSNVLLRQTLIDFLVNRNDFNGAIEQFQAMNNAGSMETEHLTRWGTLVLQNTATPESERKTEAVKIWNRITEKAPNDPNAAVSTADLFAKNNFHDEAERCYKQAIALRPNDFSYRESLATFYHRQGSKEKIVSVLLPEDQQFIAAHRAEIGQRFLTFELIPEAEQLLRQAVQAEPQHATLQCQYLETLLRQNTPESIQGVQQFFTNIEKQITDDEQFALFLQQEVQLLRTMQRTAQAVKIVQSHLETTFSLRSLWHLAMLYQAEADIPAASRVVENAAEKTESQNLPLPFLRFMAELYEQSGNTEKSIALYQKLVQEDPPRSGNYWQQIITLQVQRGELPLALESSQKLLGRGTENAERLRFVAELFLSVNRRTEALKLLQQALILEPGNTDVLRVLAQTYIDSQQHEEAVELLWRLYERLKEFPAKLSVIEMLTNEYTKLGKDDELIEHLQQLSRNHEHRREAMQALVRVFIIQGEDGEAKNMLESLLAMPIYEQDGNKTDFESVTHWILRELVGIAEKQEDFAAAVRYQEMLCQKLSDPLEQNHLFELYAKLGDAAKTRKMFFDQVLLQGDVQDKFKLIDTMVRSEQYDIASQVLDFLAIHEPEHWGILFRQILVEAYQNKPVESLVQKFRSMESVHASVVPAVPVEESKTFIFSATAPVHLNQSLGLQNQFLPILFRPEILKDQRLQGQHFGNLAIADILTFEEARFLALGVLLREAMNKDFTAVNENPTVMQQFRTTIETLRNMLPADSSKNDVLMERLRLEVWLLDLLAFDHEHALFTSGMLKLQIDSRLCQKNIEQVIRKSALDGITDWQPALLQILTVECINELVANRFKEKLSSDERLSAKIVQTLDALCLVHKIPPISAEERNKMINDAISLVKRSSSDHQSSLRKNPLSLAQKTERILSLWQECRGQLLSADHYGLLLWILRSQNRHADVQSVEQFLRRTAQENPSWYAENISVFIQQVDDNLLLFNTLQEYDSLETRLQRVKKEVDAVLPFYTDKKQKESFCMELFSQLEYLNLWGIHLKRYDIFTPTERTWLDFSSEQLWSFLHQSVPTQQALFAQQLFGVEAAPPSHLLVLQPDQMNRLVELDTALRQYADFMFYIFDELKITPSDIAVPLPVPAEQKITLARFRMELQGDRPIDRSMIYSLVQNPVEATRFSAVDLLFCRILLLRRAMDTKTKFAGMKTDERITPIKENYTAQFYQFLENKKRSTVESDRTWSTHLSAMFDDLLMMKTPSLEQTAGSSPEAGLLQFAQKLETEQKNRMLTSAEKLALALFYVRLQRFADTARMLDTLELNVATDLQMREWIIAHLAAKYAKPETPPSALFQRGNEAADKLLDFRLSERDSLALVPILQKFERKEEALQLWNNLVETVSDRRLLSEMLYKMIAEGEPQKENTVKIARRILLNPSFLQNSRRLTSDVNLLTSAVKVLREQNQAESVIPIVENRLRGLRDKTDSRLLLAKLNIMLDRQELAKSLVLELAKEPSAEPERRQMIVSLLVHFGMQKELETMNRLLLEQNTR